MAEPFYEEVKPVDGRPYNPFSCHMCEFRGTTQFSGAHWHYRIEILYAVE
jgi:hypothetical protein